MNHINHDGTTNKKKRSNSLTLNVPLLLLGITVALNASTTVGAQDQPGYEHIKSPANSMSVNFGPNDATPTSSVHIDQVQGEQSKDLKSKLSSLALHGTDLQAIDESAVNELVAVKNGFNNILSDMQLFSSDDTTSASDTLKAAAKAMSLTKDRFTDLQLTALLPSHFKDMLLRTVDEVSKAKKYVHKVEGFISDSVQVTADRVLLEEVSSANWSMCFMS